MASFWLDDDGKYYYQQSTTELVSEDGKYLFKITPAAPAAPATGNPIGTGWLMFITYP